MAGANWDETTNAGPRTRNGNNSRTNVNVNNSSRGSARYREQVGASKPLAGLATLSVDAFRLGRQKDLGKTQDGEEGGLVGRKVRKPAFLILKGKIKK